MFPPMMQNRPKLPASHSRSPWLIALCLLLATFGAWGQPDSLRPVNTEVREWQKALDDAEKDLAKPDISNDRLGDWRDQLSDMVLEARGVAAMVAPDIQSLHSDLAALGTPPAQDAPSEAPNVIARRKELNAELASLEGAAKEAGLVSIRASRLLAEVKAIQRDRFTDSILARGQSPLAPAIWKKALPELGAGLGALYANLDGWFTWDLFLRIVQPLAVGVGLAVLLAFPVRAGLIRKFGYVAVEGEPTYMQRLWAALFTGFVRALLPSAAALAVYLSLFYVDLLNEAVALVLRVGLLSLIALFFVVGFARSALAPYEPDWRLVPIHNRGARAVSRAITGLAVLFALDRTLGELANQYDVSVEWVSAQKFIFGVLIALELLALLRREVWYADSAQVPAHWWEQPRCWLMLPVAAIPLSAMLGYVVLSRLLATQWVLTGGLYAAVALLSRITQESVDHALSGQSGPGRKLRESLALNDDGTDMLAFWLGGLLRALVLLLGGLILPLLWGVPWKDVNAWLTSVFLGFQLGDLTISLRGALVALLSFSGLLLLTRLLQKTLDQRIFPKTRLDQGIQHSIRSGVGYAGFALALMIGVSTVGLDLSNLAIIAGALSVGIGLGLQNIVNNFVSGLILLVERPIKTGDWVVVGEHQGYVKKISVRATEISTFDRASVFIPNSSLISGTVMNRTYADKTGRVVLPIGLAYHADPNKARRLLLDIAHDHPDIRENPPPTVNFLGFGDSALNLELVAILHDVDKVKLVTSDLCFAIYEAFKREGIEIPFPQRDIKVSLDEEQLRRYL